MPAVINGYCDELSGFPGQTVTLRVATDAAAFAVHVYRQGAALEGPLLSTSWIDGAGYRGEEHQPSDDWGKPGHRFFSGDDGYRHAILAIDDGDIDELFFRP